MNVTRSSTQIGATLALILALIVVAASAASFSRKVDTFQTLGFEAALQPGHWLVTTVQSEATGLRVSDQVLLINGEGAGGVVELRAALAGRAESDLLVLRGEEMVPVTYERPALRFDIAYLVLSVTGLLYLLIGFYTLWRDRRKPAKLFYLWCLTSAALYLVTPSGGFDTVGKALFVIDHVARLFLAPLTLHLFLVFPSPLFKSGWVRRLTPLIYLPAAVLLTIQVDLMNGGRLIAGADMATALRALDQLEQIHLIAFALIALGVLIWRLAAHNEWEQRRQMTWIAIGLGAGYLPFLALYTVPRSLALDPPRLVVLAAVLPLSLVPLTFAYAILRYKLWDIGVIVRNTISLSLTILIGIFSFSLTNLAIGQLTVDASTLARNMLTFTAGLLIAGLLVPTRRGIQSSLSRLQYGRQYYRRRALADFGKDLLRETDLTSVCEALLQRLGETVELDRVNLLLNHDGLLKPVRAEPELPTVNYSDSLGEHLWKGEVSSLSGIALPADELPLEQRLFALDYRYLLPLEVRDKRVGVLITSYNVDGTPLSSDDLDLIRNLLQQTALAIDNAKLIAQVHNQLSEVTRLQEFSQGIFESAPAGIAVFDSLGRVISANEAFARLTENDLEGLKGRSIKKVMQGQTLPKPEEGILEALFRTPSGEERYFQLSTANLSREDDNDHSILILQDVSERVAMEHALKEKDRLASLGMLAAGVAHEVNTPITGISSYAQLLLSDMDEDDPSYEILKKVERQTFRASKIVNNLLDFSRDDKHELRALDLAPTVREAIELLKERRLENNVSLGAVELDEGLLVNGDEGELQQVITNLLVNAIDAMADGGDLNVSLSANDKWVWLAVEDDGPGMSPKELERIFQPFFSTKLGKGGTGLGLSISYNIVRRHGGEIRVVSHQGEGSQFIVELPRITPMAVAE